MKRTKSMIYKESDESRELFLVAVNDGYLYRNMILPIIENLKKKYKKGIYNSDRAIDLWYKYATQASKKYFKDFGYMFTVTERYTAAIDLEKYFEEDIAE